VYLGGILGPTGVGLLGWAQKWAYMPLRLFMDHVLKVTFPAFSRMQDDRDHLVQSLERSIFFVCFLVFPAVTGLLIMAPLLVDIIPRYEKWEPALLPLMLISINTLFAAATTQLTNLLNAVGKIRVTFKLMVMWTALTWIFVPFMAVKYGVNGAAFGYAMVGMSSVIAIVITKKIINFSVYKSVLPSAFATLIMTLALLILRSFLSANLTSIVLIGLVGAIVYFFAMYVVVGKVIIADAKKGILSVFSRG